MVDFIVQHANIWLLTLFSQTAVKEMYLPVGINMLRLKLAATATITIIVVQGLGLS